VETMPVGELPALVDDLARLAGEYFASLAALGGAAYKMEMNLARFHRRHLARSSREGYLPLLVGLQPPGSVEPHAVASLDWFDAPPPIKSPAEPHAISQRLVGSLGEAEEAAFSALAQSPRRLDGFRRLLADTQHVVRLREEQARELTLPWPVMRRAVLRIGERLTSQGAIDAPGDVFFLTREEALAALNDVRNREAVDIGARRAMREQHRRLVPPLLVGRVSRVLEKMFEAFPRMLGAVSSPSALVSGVPASPGRATGPVRVIRGPQDFDDLQPGEILVAPLTAPAWTPLFTRAIAVVTDVGSAAAHASIIAREFGIPAVVGCGDATARLATGMRVTVDGNTGNVVAAEEAS
jgi:rifampicin phosphotransferase